MKTIMMIGLLLTTLHANADTTFLFSRTVSLPVDISTAKVVKTNKGYGELYLVKILVPELARETLMNHRNEDESAPCLATYDALTVDQIIQNNPGIEIPTFKIELKKTTFPDVTNKFCRVTLTETVTTEIRGFRFIHARSSDLPNRVLEDCL